MSEEQQNVVDIGANADMNSQPDALQRMSNIMSRARTDRDNNVSNIVQEAKVQELEIQNQALANLLNEEKRKNNDPMAKFDRFKSNGFGGFKVNLSHQKNAHHEVEDVHAQHDHDPNEKLLEHEKDPNHLAELAHLKDQGLEHDELTTAEKRRYEHEHEHDHEEIKRDAHEKSDMEKAWLQTHDADSDDDHEIHDADSDDDEELHITKIPSEIEDSRRRRAQNYEDKRHRPISLDDDHVPEKAQNLNVHHIEGDDGHKQAINLDSDNDFMMSSYDHQLISHAPTTSFNMTPPEQLGKTDTTNLYAGLIHVLIILAVIYMVTQYKQAIKYSEELKAKVEKMIGEKKLGFSKKEDDIAYASADLEDKSEDDDEDVDAEKEDLVQV